MTKGSSQFKRGVFRCRMCGRRTTGADGLYMGGEMCAQCDEASMQENAILDGYLTPEQVAETEAEILRLKREAVKLGGSASRLGLETA